MLTQEGSNNELEYGPIKEPHFLWSTNKLSSNDLRRVTIERIKSEYIWSKF